jgi:hypothetical protein
MSPAPPLDVIVSVQMPLLTSAVVYVAVDGFWQETDRPVVSWRLPRAPVTTWRVAPSPAAAAWKEK